MLSKEEALQSLQSGETLFVPTWYITMCDNHVYATCGYENCCQDDWDTFEEFWEFHGNNIEMKKA